MILRLLIGPTIIQLSLKKTDKERWLAIRTQFFRRMGKAYFLYPIQMETMTFLSQSQTELK